ncbi:MAG: phosphopantetheine adenylyltransferase [Nitrososphaerales archaeon]
MPSPHTKYRSIALGGTFDQIHRGHNALFERAFATGNRIYIGLTSDNFVSDMGKKIQHDFDFRKKQLEDYLRSAFPGRKYVITSLDSVFGPGMYSGEIDAIAVSAETLPSVESANNRRRVLGLKDLAVEVVPMLNADDGKKISSTRIRNGEIDSDGRVRKNRS